MEIEEKEESKIDKTTPVQEGNSTIEQRKKSNLELLQERVR